MADDSKVEIGKDEHARLVALAGRVEAAEAALADAGQRSAGGEAKAYTDADMVDVTDGSAVEHPPVPKAWIGTPLARGLKVKRK
jgi:hypothetical protein